MNYVIFAILGLCFGSFVNAWVWRLHEQSKPKKARAATDKELSITKGRSMCPNCKHTLATKDLIPVLSWLSLGGKCRYCKKPISWQYPLVELLTSLLFIMYYIYLPVVILQGQALQTLAFLVFLGANVIGMALAVYDFKWMLLPDRLVKILGILGLSYTLVALIQSNEPIRTLFGILFAILVSGGLFYILYQISDGKWIGGGDVKMGLVLGLFLLTPLNAGLMLFLASFIGCFYALALLVVGKYKKGVHIPFGPALLLATYIVVLFGTEIINTYQNLIFP